MNQLRVNDRVRLSEGIPEVQVSRDMIGVVRSVWFAPVYAYEVEFHLQDQQQIVRVLVLGDQVQAEVDNSADAETEYAATA